MLTNLINWFIGMTGTARTTRTTSYKSPIKEHLDTLRQHGLGDEQIQQCRDFYKQLPQKDWHDITERFLKIIEEDKKALNEKNFVGYCLLNYEFPVMVGLF